jgi:hypothetical protein
MKILPLKFVLLLTLAASGCGKIGNDSASNETVTVTVVINESIMPIERGKKYGQPLNDYLESLDIGEVLEGGTSLSAAGAPEKAEIVLKLTDPEKSLEGIASKLRELGAPDGSHLYYNVGEVRRELRIR